MSTVATLRPSTRNPPTDQEVQEQLLLGLLNRWHPILRSDLVETGGKPLGLTRLGATSGAVARPGRRDPRPDRPLSSSGGAALPRDQRRRPAALQLSWRRNRGGRHRTQRAGPTRLPPGRLEGGQHLSIPRDRRRDLRVVRRRQASGTGALRRPRGIGRRRLEPVSLLRRMERALAVRGRQRHGPHARDVPARKFPHHVPGRHPGAVRDAGHR